MGIEIEAGTKTFASGLLPELIVAVRRSRPGNLFTIIGSDLRLGEDLATWCRFTRNTLVETDQAGKLYALGDPLRRGSSG